MGVRVENFRAVFLHCPPDGTLGGNEYRPLRYAAERAGYSVSVRPAGDAQELLEVRVDCDVRRCVSPSDFWASVRDTDELLRPQREVYAPGMLTDAQTRPERGAQIHTAFVSARARDVHEWIRCVPKDRCGFKTEIYVLDVIEPSIPKGTPKYAIRTAGELPNVTGYVPRERLMRTVRAIMHNAARDIGEAWLAKHYAGAERVTETKRPVRVALPKYVRT